MSTPASEADDITQLSFELEGLRISITRTRTAGPSGPTALAGPARAPVAAFEAAPSTPVASSGHRGSSAGSLGRSPNPHTRSPVGSPEPRSAIEASFPAATSSFGFGQAAEIFSLCPSPEGAAGLDRRLLGSCCD